MGVCVCVCTFDILTFYVYFLLVVNSVDYVLICTEKEFLDYRLASSKLALGLTSVPSGKLLSFVLV